MSSLGYVLLAPYSAISDFTSVLQGSDLSETRWTFLEPSQAARSNGAHYGAVRCIVNPLDLNERSKPYSAISKVISPI